ncbi:MAG: diguanylate cyclase (GGDEF)-like protein [Verrucomicrobiales bacterium]|jgi:diguanylate cyclase (GGDEF)-like protein
MSHSIIPTAWSNLLQSIKPFSETDFVGVLGDAASILGIEAANIDRAGRSIARFGGLRDFSGSMLIELPHSGAELQVVHRIDPSDDDVSALEGLANVLDLALTAEDRRTQAASMAIVSPMGAKDRLTKAVDRDAFIDYLEVEFAAGPEDSTVMVVGLDGMSVVNETLGHTVGDIVLAETADRLRDTLRSCDIVSRLGGDVFGIYCPNIAIDTATELARRLQTAIAMPISVQGNELRVTASAGIAARARGEKAALTLSNADTALRAAKGEIAGKLVIYDGTIRMRTEHRRLLAVELVDALDDNQLMAALDPIVHLPGGSIVGMEAHVVWKHPTQGNIDRGEFMDLAELIGRVSDVERAVLEFALAETSTDHSEMWTGMNLSGSTLRDPVAIGWIIDRVSSAPNKMIMEVRESAFSNGGASVVRHLRALREAGASIVLDDFGISVGSLRTLHAFPFDGVKLHNALLAEGDALRTNAIVKAVYASSAVVGFDIVHTGVDDDLDLRRLLDLDSGISSDGFYAQGAAVRAQVAWTAA